MDEIALLRTVLDDVDGPSASATARGRQALLERISAESAGGGSSARHPFFTRRAAVVAGASVAALGVSVLVVAPLEPAPAEASVVLARAARRAASSPLTQAGRTIEITRGGLLPIWAGSQSGPDVVVWQKTVQRERIPEPGQPWLRKRASLGWEYRYGDRSKIPEDMLGQASGDLQRWGYERSKLGTFVNNPGPRSEGRIGDYPDEIQELPHDPDRLLAALEADSSGAGAGTGWEVLSSAESVLTSGVADRDLRAAVFTALQKMPDLAIVAHHATDMDGRVGVAIGVKPGLADPTADHNSVQLLIDPATGEYLGGRAVTSRPDGLIPAGVLMSIDTVKYDVATTTDEWTVPKGQVMAEYP